VEATHFFDCENPNHLARLNHPLLSLEGLKGLIIIDEIQFRPDLFSVLRVLVDHYPEQRYLITGSASRDLINQSSESLAGRIGFQQITPFTIDEVKDWRLLWHRGGFPKSYLASHEKFSKRWRSEYIKTFLERDINKMGFDLTPAILGKLWRMLAHMHGQILKTSDFSNALNLDPRTVHRYLGILEGTFMIRHLRPWHTNMGKREVKHPKVYIRDCGILHELMGLSGEDIEEHPKLAASFEGYALEKVMHFLQNDDNCYFWSTHGGAELDLFYCYGNQRIGFEFKFSDTPKITKSMHIAIQDLDLQHLYVVVPLGETFKIHEKITCVPLTSIGDIRLPA
jgi:predicted AAA+ superfamily ATPase